MKVHSKQLCISKLFISSKYSLFSSIKIFPNIKSYTLLTPRIKYFSNKEQDTSKIKDNLTKSTLPKMFYGDTKKVFLSSTDFDDKGEYLILTVDKSQKTVLFKVIFISISSLLIFSLIAYKLKTKSTSKLKTVLKVFFGIIVFLVFFLSLYMINSFLKDYIKQIHLLKTGKKIKISYYLKTEIIDIKDFIVVQPKDYTKTQLDLAYEGFLVKVNGKPKMLSKKSDIHNKRVLSSIGRNEYIEVI